MGSKHVSTLGLMSLLMAIYLLTQYVYHPAEKFVVSSNNNNSVLHANVNTKPEALKDLLIQSSSRKGYELERLWDSDSMDLAMNRRDEQMIMLASELTKSDVCMIWERMVIVHHLRTIQREAIMLTNASSLLEKDMPLVVIRTNLDKWNSKYIKTLNSFHRNNDLVKQKPIPSFDSQTIIVMSYYQQGHWESILIDNHHELLRVPEVMGNVAQNYNELLQDFVADIFLKPDISTMTRDHIDILEEELSMYCSPIYRD